MLDRQKNLAAVMGCYPALPDSRDTLIMIFVRCEE
jgi:hypothetical protein